MTFKKINKSACPVRTPHLSTAKSCFVAKRCGANGGQSIFEYVILTAAIMAVVLIFGSTFNNIKTSLDTTFDGIVQEILK